MIERRYVIIKRGKVHEVWEVEDGERYIFSALAATTPTIERARTIRNALEGTHA